MKSTQIRLQITNYELQIERNRNTIRKKEREYESLVGFKKNIATYQNSFLSGNNGKIQALKSVSEITINCEMAFKYYNGMKKLVNVSGGKIINILLENLIESAQDSMSSCLKKITELETQNDRLRRKIERLRQDLKIAEMEESLAEANK